jgi:hypothetical protein
MTSRTGSIVVSIIAFAVTMQAQDARGHWAGTVEIPNQPLTMEVDLDKTPANVWIGSLAIPVQKATGIPLDAITSANGKCSFRIKGAPGDPTFAGTLSADGKTLTGNFNQGPASFPFKFTRTGDPKVETVKANPAVGKELLGSWEGTLEAGQPLRLVLKISNSDAGATAVFVSLDQNGVEIPVNTIDQKGTKVKFEARMINGSYDAEISPDGSELNGQWSQGGGSAPLKLKKAGAPKTP